MTTYNIILFTDVVRSNKKENLSIPGIGAYKLANTLRNSGYSCLVVNHISEFTIDEVYKLLDKTVSDETYLIGFSTTFFNKFTIHNDSVDILGENFNLFPQGTEFDDQIFEHLKQLNSKVKVTVGGPLIRADIKCKYADFLVLGYAEANIVNLVDHIKTNVPLKNSYKNVNNNKIVINNVLADGYEFTTDTMTWLPEDIVNHTKLPIEIGRGCVFSCSFCSYPMNGKQKLDFIKQISIIKDELMYNYTNYKVTNYAIVDDTFNDSVEKLEQLREMIITLPFKPIFWCYARLDLICTRPETLDMLYDIGIREMFFGIETLDRKSGLAIGKGYNREKQIEMISRIKETYPDIHLHGSFLVGTPHETIESINKTLNALITHEIKLDSCQVRTLLIGKTINGIVFESSITKDYKKFGYREMPNHFHHNNIVWENDHLNYFKARELAQSFLSMYKSKKQSSQRQAMQVKFPPNLFLLEYKRKLFDLITNQKVD